MRGISHKDLVAHASATSVQLEWLIEGIPRAKINDQTLATITQLPDHLRDNVIAWLEGSLLE